MISKEKIKEIIKAHDRINVIVRCLANLNDPGFLKLIKGYYEMHSDFTTSLIQHNGEKLPDETIYHITYYKTTGKNNTKRGTAGFCAALVRTLRELFFSDFFRFIPVVEWGNAATYYDSGMDSVTRNVFEYYFTPVSEIGYLEIGDCRNVIEGRAGHAAFFTKHVNSYETEQDELEKLGYIYKKYIHLNPNTEEYIKENVNDILNGKSILAVHVRGTDYNLDLKDHPKIITFGEYLEKTNELFSTGRYEKVFLATDDANALGLFKQEFQDKLLYYRDVFRTKDNIGSHNTSSERTLHYYRLGLEVLRDVYTLANCASLICGLSQVSFAARYVNIALNRKYEEVVIMDNGINTEDAIEMRKSL